MSTMPVAISERVAPVPELDDEVKEIVDGLREKFADLLEAIDDNIPDSREKSLVVTNIEQAFLWLRQCVEQNDIP